MIDFIEKEQWTDGDPLIGRTYVPIYMVKDGIEYFVINRVAIDPEPGYGKNHVEQAAEDVARIKTTLLDNGGRYFKFYGFYDNPLDMLAEMRRSAHTFVEPQSLYADCREHGPTGSPGFVDFHGNRNEVSAAFRYRIYDFELLDEIQVAASIVGGGNTL